MRWGCRTVLACVASSVLAAPAAAATVNVRRVERPGPDLIRLLVRYDGHEAPTFRVVSTCTSPRARGWVVATTARIAHWRREAKIELRDDFDWIADPASGCEMTGLSLEMLHDGEVTAQTRVPLAFRSPLARQPPPDPERAPSRVALEKVKFAAPQSRTSAAGVRFAVSENVALQLRYERTTVGRSVPHDVENGLRTALTLRF